jgi:Ankyrin repeats (3 copies)
MRDDTFCPSTLVIPRGVQSVSNSKGESDGIAMVRKSLLGDKAAHRVRTHTHVSRSRAPAVLSLMAFCAVFVACGQHGAINGGYTADFYWDYQLRDLKISSVYGTTLTPTAERTLRTELQDTIKTLVSKANVQSAKGTLAFTASGKPPYVVLVKRGEITQPPISDLMAAVEREDIATIASLVSRYGNVNQKELPGQRTALHNACAGGKDKSVDELLVLGADPNSSDFERDTPLIVSVAANYRSIARRLIAAGANVNQVNQVGATPLIRAAELDRTGMVKLLLQSGADPTLKAMDGETALMAAEAHHNAHAAAVLRQSPGPQ